MNMRKFKNQSFPDSTGATRRKTHSCDCVIIYDKNENYLGDEFKCKLHQTLSGQALMDEATKHDQDINNKHGSISYPAKYRQRGLQDAIEWATEENDTVNLDLLTKLKDVEESKNAEKERIRRL